MMERCCSMFEMKVEMSLHSGLCKTQETKLAKGRIWMNGTGGSAMAQDSIRRSKSLTKGFSNVSKGTTFARMGPSTDEDEDSDAVADGMDCNTTCRGI